MFTGGSVPSTETMEGATMHLSVPKVPYPLLDPPPRALLPSSLRFRRIQANGVTTPHQSRLNPTTGCTSQTNILMIMDRYLALGEYHRWDVSALSF
ncbi:hypothetical protein PIIN_11557 [Serendipita indica DSM 11827]|uniref:Uncharacterized protein n=1 Tax=Serendipita indica (strain DSM 11827) TaxID=1109443 RepID=G4U1Y7_SERID|nr:hypothetical protein PIIN_11557 [Serendipita indica DSM 11827]